MRPVLVVEHGADAPLGRLAPFGADVDLRRPHAGDPLPADLEGHGALLVLGGQMAAWEDDGAPWLPATRALLARGAREAVPVLGICLGAQLLALATGGRVERGARGPEAGLLPVTATPDGCDDSLVGPLARGAHRALGAGGAERGEGAGGAWLVPQGHGDAVTALPDDAVLLASSDAYRVQAFRVGPAAWGVQYHPEVTPADLGAWLDDLGGALRARGTSAVAELEEVAAHEAELRGLADHHRRHLLAAAGAAAAASERVGALRPAPARRSR